MLPRSPAIWFAVAMGCGGVVACRAIFFSYIFPHKNICLPRNINIFCHWNIFLTNTWLQLAHEAVKCEEKEEKLVKDAVQHLTQANSQIKDLHHQFTHKVL